MVGNVLCHIFADANMVASTVEGLVGGSLSLTLGLSRRKERERERYQGTLFR